VGGGSPANFCVVTAAYEILFHIVSSRAWLTPDGGCGFAGCLDLQLSFERSATHRR